MADNTHIEWTDATWNVVTGCTKVSAGCDNCYIERTPPFRMAHRRFDRPGVGASTGVKLHPDRLATPREWTRPRRIFVCSLADLFHDDVPQEYIAQVFAAMVASPQHTFQVLTKRPARMRSLLRSPNWRGSVAGYVRSANPTQPLAEYDRQVEPFVVDGALPHIWLGVSAEDQKHADLRIPILLDTPASVRWVSAEPLLGPIDLTRLSTGSHQQPGMVYDALNQRYGVPGRWQAPASARVAWVVAGGESGPAAPGGPGVRPMHPEWVRSLRDQCEAAGVAFLFKQWGDWAPYASYFAGDRDEQGPWDTYVNLDGTSGQYALSEEGHATNWTGDPREGNQAMTRAGKKAAGRTLDGRTWDEYPQPRVAVAS